MPDSTDLGAAWREFCKKLESLGDFVTNSSFAEDPIDQAEGYRYITRLMRIALDMHMENSDTDFPHFFAASHATAKIGADNPDNIYMNACISGSRRYRVWGKRNTVPVLSIATKANRYAVDGTMASTGEIDSADFVLEPDGRFEIIVSPVREGKNWLPIAADSSMMLVRQTFLDRANEIAAELQIEALDAPRAAPAPFDARQFSEGLVRTAAFMAGTARTFAQWTQMLKAEQFNTLATTDQTMFQRAGGDPTIFYLHGYWKLGAGEALVIDTKIPRCAFWNFQCDNVWFESLNYRHHRIHVNGHGARLNADGSVTLILAARDPGYGNWIDTAGHQHGTMLLRWTAASEHPVPATRLVTLDG